MEIKKKTHTPKPKAELVLYDFYNKNTSTYQSILSQGIWTFYNAIIRYNSIPARFWAKWKLFLQTLVYFYCVVWKRFQISFTILTLKSQNLTWNIYLLRINILWFVYHFLIYHFLKTNLQGFHKKWHMFCLKKQTNLPN